MAPSVYLNSNSQINYGRDVSLSIKLSSGKRLRSDVERILARIRFDVASTFGMHVSHDHYFQHEGAGIAYLRVHEKRLPFRDLTSRIPPAGKRVQRKEDLEGFPRQEPAADASGAEAAGTSTGRECRQHENTETALTLKFE